MEDVYFPFHIWNHFDSIDERPRINNHFENVYVQTNPEL